MPTIPTPDRTPNAATATTLHSAHVAAIVAAAPLIKRPNGTLPTDPSHRKDTH